MTFVCTVRMAPYEAFCATRGRGNRVADAVDTVTVDSRYCVRDNTAGCCWFMDGDRIACTLAFCRSACQTGPIAASASVEWGEPIAQPWVWADVSD